MTATSWRSRWFWLPWLAMLGVDAFMGWLEPTYWLGAGLPPHNPGSSMALLPKGAVQSSKGRASSSSPLPWPDEPALRQRLLWHGLTPLGLTLSPQRGRTQELRLWLRWQGSMGDGLGMLESLANQWPQMSADSLTMIADTPGIWRFEWRGAWRQTQAPIVVPTHTNHLLEYKRLANVKVLDPGWLGVHQRKLYVTHADPGLWLRLALPEQLQLLAVAHDPMPQAWVGWQQHVLLLRVGDRIGPDRSRVSVIHPAEVEIRGPAGLHRLRPLASQTWPDEGSP